MKIKNTTAAILAAAAMTAATTAWAVDAAPASVPQITENAQPQVGIAPQLLRPKRPTADRPAPPACT